MASRRSKATKKELSRDRILSTATRIVRRKGSAGLSMRSLASDLGVSAPSIYWHFRTREELVGEIVRTMVAELEIEDPGGEWTERARAAVLGLRRAVFARPELLSLIRDASSATAELAPLEMHFLLILREGGFDGTSCVRGARLLNWHLWSSIEHENRLDWRLADDGEHDGSRIYEFPLSVLTHDDFSRIPSELLPHLSQIDADDLFQFALDALLTRLETERRAAHKANSIKKRKKA